MAKERKMIGRIRYIEHYVIGGIDEGEHYLFEWKWSDEDENQWSLDCAAKLWNFGEYHDMIHYTALTKVREWMKLGIDFWFC